MILIATRKIPKNSVRLLFAVTVVCTISMVGWIDLAFRRLSLPLDIEEEGTTAMPGCTVPEIPTWPEYFSKWDPTVYKEDCSYKKNLIKLSEGKIIKLHPGENCCIQEITRGVDDSTFELSDCKPFGNDSEEDIGLREAFMVQCENLTHFDASIQPKPIVEEKVGYWEGIPSNERPYSVLILGIDSVSRSHVHRSLPKTVNILNQLGFVDFKSYHSVAPSTLPNLMAMLMGMTDSEVRGSCAHTWSHPFDDCPLIWQTFHANKYVTAYIEDGSQSFNWGGQSGFLNQPTDYYLHHLFLSHDEAHQNIASDNSELPKCTSEETVPEFMIRYTGQWLRTFPSTPFFFMSWFANPFHDYLEALASYDDGFANLFGLIRSESELLEKSLIILVGDHGDRTGFFHGTSIESYFERALPPLFIRLPDQMKGHSPDILEALRSNALKLTTPFDIHHSLLHLLSSPPGSALPNLAQSESANGTPEQFQPNRADRVSLFEHVPSHRTCATTNIPQANCLCNSHYIPHADNDEPISSDLASKLVLFSIANLNTMVANSNYSHLCCEWSSDPEKAYLNFAKHISRGNLYYEVIISFGTDPGEAEFEGRLKIHPTIDPSAEISGYVEVVGFFRTNHFGEESWCVPMETDEDKKMKELCYCKAQEEQSS